MNLPRNFQFSQSNLQDYVECQRRFQLKHLLNLSWPSLEAQPFDEYELLIELGSYFHHMVHQFVLGISTENLKVPDKYEGLALWWDNFKQAISTQGSLHTAWQTSVQRHAEVMITGYLVNMPIVAKLDFVAVLPDGKIQIYDWKTSHHIPRRSWLLERIQTKLYPYLLVQAGSFFNHNESIKPEQIEMIYWYPEQPNTPINFPYSQNQYRVDEDNLKAVLEDILQRKENEFNMTLNEQRCLYCVYRSLCARGLHAGQLSDHEQLLSEDLDTQLVIDLNQIDDISF